MSHCYINLALVKRSIKVGENHQSLSLMSRLMVQADKDTGIIPFAPLSEPRKNHPSFSLLSRLKVHADKDTDIIPLLSLFEPRTGSSQTPSVPKRILIEGRAGVGKTTLCKKIVYDHLHHQMWSHLFDWVLWVPLRKLRRRSETTVAYNLENMFYDEYFSQQPDGKDLARALWQAVNDPSLNNRVLFLLDGLDEISREWDTDTPMHDFVSHLLKQPQAIITTRPRPSDQIDLGTVDLELETVKFFPDQVNNYINHPEIVPDGGTAREIESFLQKHPLMQSLMRIPIQLDALCFSWERDLLEERPQTMTGIYQAIVLKLWRKDILQLGIRDEQGMPLTEGRVKDVFESGIEDYILNEINLIEGLAFHGLTNDIIEFRWKDRKLFYRLFERHGEKLPRAGDRVLRKVSFLRTSDDTLQGQEQSFHFLHLTFQEFFAARYFVRHWLQGKPLPCFRVGQQPTKDFLMAPRLFLQAKKYDLHYNIYWRFVAGLLQDCWQSNTPSRELVRDFFDQLDREPRDTVGPAHQRLTMHCLSEVAPASDDELISESRSSLEKRLLQWVELECKLSSYPETVAEMECPSGIITTLLGPSYERYHGQILEILYYRNVRVSQDVLDAAALLLKSNAPVSVRRWAVALLSRTPAMITAEIEGILVRDLHHEDSMLRRYAASALFQRSLSRNTIQDLLPLLRHRDELISGDCLLALKAAVDLPENVIQSLMLLFREDKIVYPNDAPAPILAPQNKFSDSTILTLGTHLKDNMARVRYRAAAALELEKSLLPDWIIHNLVQLLEDESSSVRGMACEALCAQKSLPKEALFRMIPVLHNALMIDGFLSEKTEQAIKILRSQPVLPDDIRHALSLLLKAEASCTRFAAGWALASQDNLSEETLNSMALLLEEANVKSTQLERTFRFLKRQRSLRQIILRALHLRLKDHDSKVRRFAAFELGEWLPLPAEILHDLVLLLKDPETRFPASDTIGKHSAIPDEIIQSLDDLLRDKDVEVRNSAAAALRSQKELPSKLLHSHVFVLGHCRDGFVCHATEWLKWQRRLPGDITEALAMLLDDKCWVVKDNAMTVLLEQSHLAENVLHDIAMLHFYPRIEYQNAWRAWLGSRSDLHPKTVKALAALLEKDDPSRVEEVLRVQSSFYPLVPTLSRQALKNLFRCWIPLAFDTQICCFLDNGKLIIDGPKGRFELDFESDQQREQFIQVIQQVQMDLGFPTAGTSSDEQSPVPSRVTRKPSGESAGFASVLDSPSDSERKAGVVSRFRCLKYTGRILVVATIAVLIQVCTSPPFPCVQ
jgi:HEAT repeat protein/GTPase SAR1 family protein